MSEPAGTPLVRALPVTAAVAVLLALPFYVAGFWLQTGLFAMAAAIGAIGLTILSGTTGQLSLGHAFFLAVGAYGYLWTSGESETVAGHEVSGLGLHPLVAVVAAVALAGAAGGLFSPVSGRLRGMYLGVATLALVFVGEHVLVNSRALTGGYNGREAEPMRIGGFTFGDSDPELTVLGIAFGELERLWYFGLLLVLIAVVTARNLLRGRPGRALGAVRDSEIAASVMGVPVARYRSAAFVVSSMYAGLAGALLALSFGRVVPEYFGLMLSIDYLAMIVVGGLGSVGGAVAGAVFVTVLPQVFTRFAGSLPLVSATPGGQGVGPVEASRYLYGAAIVVVLLFAPGGLAGLGRRFAGALPRRPAFTSRSSSTGGAQAAAVTGPGAKEQM